MTSLAAVGGAVFALGLVLVVAWFRPVPPKPVRTRQRRSLRDRWAGITPRTKATLALGGVVGLVVAAITQILVLFIAIPAAFVGLPALLAKPSTRENDLILALETWARSLASTAETGAFTLREVVGISRTAAPDILRDPVDRLYARMSTTWSAPAALRTFADELDSPDADEVVIYLVQAAKFSSGGLAKALSSVADALAEQAKLRIEMLAERDRPRQVLTQMTLIVAILIVMFVGFGGEGMSFYRTPAGGLVLALIIGLFVLALIWGKRVSKVKPYPRIILASTVDQMEPAP